MHHVLHLTRTTKHVFFLIYKSLNTLRQRLHINKLARIIEFSLCAIQSSATQINTLRQRLHANELARIMDCFLCAIQSSATQINTLRQRLHANEQT